MTTGDRNAHFQRLLNVLKNMVLQSFITEKISCTTDKIMLRTTLWWQLGTRERVELDYT